MAAFVDASIISADHASDEPSDSSVATAYDPNDGSFSAIVGELNHTLGHATHTALQAWWPGARDVYVLPPDHARAFIELIAETAEKLKMTAHEIEEVRRFFEWKYCSFGAEVAFDPKECEDGTVGTWSLVDKMSTEANGATMASPAPATAT